MSRSVSAPSSVTKTSPCWNGLIVPGSTFRYGSNFCTCTFMPRAFSRRPSEAAVMPFPSEETTPPVTKTYFGGRRATTGAPAGPGGGGTGPLGAPQPVEAGEDRRAFDQLAERTGLAHGGQTGERCDCKELTPGR